MSERPEPRAGLREQHQRQIVDLLRLRGSVDRREIARETGFSRSAVSAHISQLRARGVVVEGPAGGGGQQLRRGRPPVEVRLTPSSGAVLAIAFDHQRLRLGVLDLSFSLIAERSVELTLFSGTGGEVVRPAEALDVAVGLACSLLEDSSIDRGRVLGAGLAFPAPVDQRRGVVASETILRPWRTLDLAKAFSEQLDIPVEVDNDANVGALGELHFGAGRGVSDFIYVKHAPGLGAGVVVNGFLVRGASGIAGEVGHIQVNLDGYGPVCGCGKRGCLGPVVGQDALVELLRSTHGEGVTEDDLPQLLAQGDAVARRAVADAGRTLGQVLAASCNLLNPASIIVQGPLSFPDSPFLTGIREALERYAMPEAAKAVVVVPGELRERAELLGAAALVMGSTTRLSSARFLALATS